MTTSGPVPAESFPGAVTTPAPNPPSASAPLPPTPNVPAAVRDAPAAAPTPGAAVPPAADTAGFQDELTTALNEALDRIEQSEQSGAPGGPDGADADTRGRRRAGLRAAVSTVTTRVMAERTLRAEAAAAAAADPSVPDAPRNRERTTFSPFRWGFLGGLGVLLAFVTYQSLDTIRGTLIVIAVASLLAIGLDPPVGWLVRRGWKRGLAVMLIFLILLGVLAGAAYAIVPPVVNEVASFVTSVPTLITDLQNQQWIQELDAKYGLLQQIQSSSFVQSLVSGASTSLLTAGVTVAGILVDLLIVLILTLYFLAGFPKIKAAAWRLAPASRRPRVSYLGDKVLKQMGGYLGGATIIAIQAGIVAGVFAAVVGLPYPWAIALGAAVLDFVPVVGPIVIGVSMTLLGFTISLPVGIGAGVFYLCQHLFEAYWLYPRVMRRTVDISTGAVVVAILVGGSLLGVTGAILAVPVAAACILIVREVIMPMQERS
ncbi:AI-2E family transporter [Nakamurella flavida]|uniref:AI-2E family transporter n=1 Tax=Nakamurella flavida TaxID=363630 RepID=A0A938YQV5_9ACTN|nr:AI-2E family transporter [Nakamurella flavida]MBM9477754.1 AI-2E family transporter [Nakamurella flavida]MDP9779306.1 putative PurR-regulated permease PerM [Nakamurella flavida]